MIENMTANITGTLGEYIAANTDLLRTMTDRILDIQASLGLHSILIIVIFAWLLILTFLYAQG